MDINNLKAFIEVADKKSFSRSAESLKLTQPAVSKRIAALESELSAKLFDRVGRSVHLTEAGRVLLPSARQISSELSRIEDVICNLGNEISGTLCVGTTEHIGTYHLPAILKSFRSSYPDVEISLHFANSENTLKALTNGLLEIALCSTPGGQRIHSKLTHNEAWKEKLVIAVSKTHPLASESTINLESLSKCPAILPPVSTFTRKAIDDAMNNANLQTMVSIEASDFETIRSMTSIGLGWACIPDFQVDESLAVLDVEQFELSYSVSLVRHQDRTLSRAATAFLDAMAAKK